MAYDDLPNIWCSMSTLNNRRVRQALEFEIGIPSTSRIIPHIFFGHGKCDPAITAIRPQSITDYADYASAVHNEENGLADNELHTIKSQDRCIDKYPLQSSVRLG
jgi:hypothetical protein